MKTRKLILPFYFATAFYLLFSLAGCAGVSLPDPPAQPIHDTLIVPGKRIGPVSVGMTASQLLETMGSPIRTGKRATGTVNEFSGEIGVYVMNDSNRVYNVRTYSSRYATEKGLRVGTGELKVRAIMGPPHIENDLDGTAYQYHYSGIVFNFYPEPGKPHNNKVTFIKVIPSD